MKPILPSGISRLKSYGFLAVFLLFLLPEIGWGQTTIHSNDCSSATSNWTFTNAGGVAIQQGGYWLVDATGDYIISPPFDVRAFTNLSLTFKVGTYGSGTNNPCIVEYSTDNGTSWAATSFTSATPTSSTLISAGTWSIGTFSSSNFRLRWSWVGSSGRGVRIDDILFSGLAFTNSTASNIITSPGFTPVSNIDYKSYTGTDVTASSLEVFRFDIQDGGGTADADAVGTILKSITINVTGAANLNKLALYDGTTELAEVGAATTTQFTGLSATAADGSSKTLSLRAVFNTAVTDNSQLAFAITAASSDAAGSAFAAANAGGASSSVTGDENRIEVTASKLVFSTSPAATATVNTNLSITPALRAYDTNNNLDLDYSSTATISNSAPLTMSSAASGFPAISFVSGSCTFPSDFQFTQTGNTNLMVSDGILTDAVSSSISVIAQYSSFSVIQAVASSEAATISSLVNTSPLVSNTDGTAVWQITLHDGDGTNDDADNLPTIYKSFSIAAGTGNTVTDWSAAIADVQLFDMSSGAKIGSTVTIGSGSILFTLSTHISIADGTANSRTIGMRLSLKTALPAGSDNKIFVFSLSQTGTIVDLPVSSSQLGAYTIATDNTKNKVEVIASKLAFVQQPSNVFANTVMSPAVTIEATDANGNRDLDISTNIDINANGATLSGAPVSVAAASGLATFSSLTFTSLGTGVTLSASRISTNDWTLSSASFNVNPTLNMYVYRSKNSGNWNNITTGNETWERSLDGISWNAVTISTNLPSSLVGAITVQSAHEVVVNINTAVDELTISSGAILTINSGVTLTVDNGTGTDILVFGELKNAGSFTHQTGSSIVFQANSHYNHTYQSGFGKLPIATWDIASTCEISGYNSSGGSPSTANLDQEFGNFKWNCAAQPATVQLNSILNNIRGNFEVKTTNNKELRLSASSGLTLNIGGNFIVQNGAWVVFSGSNSSGTWALNLTGNMQINTGGTFSHDNTTARVSINFSGANSTFINTGTITSTNMNWKVNPGAQLTLLSDLSVSSSRTFTLNGKLTTGINRIVGSGSFLLNNDGILGIGSSDGITISGASGNVQTTTRNFGIGTYIYNGTALQSTGNGLPATIVGLTIDNPAGVTLSGNTESANLTLNQGILTTSTTAAVTLASGATLNASEPSSFISGPLARKANAAGALEFPIGKGNNLRKVVLTIASTSGENTYTAEQFEGAYSTAATLPADVTHVSRIRYFNISKTGSAAVTATVQLSYGSDDGVNDESKLTIVKFSGGIAEDLFATASGGSITSSSFSTFSDFVLGNKTGGTNPLPVELLNFNAKANKNGILLTWETASEKNSSHFEIERSTNGLNFESLGNVAAAGNSQMLKRYAFEDKNPLRSLAYYRLKQVDVDGSVAYSKIVTVAFGEEKPELVLYPNPTTDKIYLKSNKNGSAEIRIINMLGQEVLTKRMQHDNTSELNLSGLPAGAYQVFIQMGTLQEVKKIIKTNP